MATELFPSRFTLLHNPRCSKSRGAKALLVERGVAFEERLYLEEPLSRPELAELQTRLGRPPREWIRKGEAALAEAGIDPSTSSDMQLLDALAAHPVLIERPILIARDRAVVGRPPERILEIIGE